MIHAFHFFVAGGIATMLPHAFERGPLWWAMLGLLLCIANLVGGVSSCLPQKEQV
jgi:hypothetical protein